MKKKINLVFALAAATVLWTSCSNDAEELTPNSDLGNGEKSFVSLTIKNDGVSTRSSENKTEATEGNESAVTIANGIKVYIFNSNGTLDYASATPLTLTEPSTGVYKSTAFEITAGTKYFFVFANDANNKITAPTSGMTMAEFMKKNIDVALNPTTYPDITDSGSKFLLGSLWGETKTAEGGGTATAPKSVSLKIGRLVAKVKLANVAYTSTSTELKGTFANAVYRLGSVPKKITTVGVHEGVKLPTADNGVLVKSAVHDAPAWATAPGDANYYDFNTTDWSTGAKAAGATNFFYTTENTTGKDGSGLQRFGNTSFIQFQTIYTPDASEVLDPVTLQKDLSYTGPTFWRARIVGTSTIPGLAGKWVILSSNPALAGNSLHADIETMTAYPEYKDGKNYHKFAIFDNKETADDVLKNRVLRNHYYEFNITKFNDLGSPTDEIDPTEPIPSKTSVDVEVIVKDWDKVTTGNVEVG